MWSVLHGALLPIPRTRFMSQAHSLSDHLHVVTRETEPNFSAGLATIQLATNSQSSSSGGPLTWSHAPSSQFLSSHPSLTLTPSFPSSSVMLRIAMEVSETTGRKGAQGTPEVLTFTCSPFENTVNSKGQTPASLVDLLTLGGETFPCSIQLLPP